MLRHLGKPLPYGVPLLQDHGIVFKEEDGPDPYPVGSRLQLWQDHPTQLVAGGTGAGKNIGYSHTKPMITYSQYLSRRAVLKNQRGLCP